ncbi:hypothetical protein BD770DRAFT_384772 [Pilaira anomala]|nr:hypothetical protein BD770DRAFT_384772 [Pilaira anomala]
MSCASTISNGFDKSSIHASTPIHLPSINELDCMIDITVVSNTQESRTTTTKRPFKRQRSTSSSSHHYPSRNECHSCKSTETPEWRKGPLGPRTLCNACGLIWTKLCKEKADEKSNSPTLSDDGHSEGTTTTTLSSTSLDHKKYTLSFLLS